MSETACKRVVEESGILSAEGTVILIGALEFAIASMKFAESIMNSQAHAVKQVDRTRAEARRLYDALEAIKVGAAELQRQLDAIGAPMSEFKSLREAVDAFLMERSGCFDIQELWQFVEERYPLNRGSSLNTTLNRALAQGKVAKVPPVRSGKWQILEEWKDKPN